MGDGDFAFAPAELEGLRSGKWRWLDTVVGRAGEQVGLKYRPLLCGWTSRRNECLLDAPNDVLVEAALWLC